MQQSTHCAPSASEFTTMYAYTTHMTALVSHCQKDLERALVKASSSSTGTTRKIQPGFLLLPCLLILPGNVAEHVPPGSPSWRTKAPLGCIEGSSLNGFFKTHLANERDHVSSLYIKKQQQQKLVNLKNIKAGKILEYWWRWTSWHLPVF